MRYYIETKKHLFMKANILHLLAVSALVALAVAFSACTPGTRIVDYPLIDGANTDNLAVERVEASDTATILHCRGFNRPHFWIRLAKETTLLADGQRFALIGAEGIEPGEMLWMPDSGDSCFTLKFEPLPKDVKKFDLSEGDEQGSWRIYGIDLTGRQREAFPSGLPQSLRQSPKADTTDALEYAFSIGESEIRLHVMGYREGMNSPVIYLNNLFQGQQELPVSMDAASATGTLKPTLYGTGRAMVVMDDRTYGDFCIAPGEQVDVYMDPSSIYELVHKLRHPELVKPRKSLWTLGSRYDALNNQPLPEQDPRENLPYYLPTYDTTSDACTDSLVASYQLLRNQLESTGLSPLMRRDYLAGKACEVIRTLDMADRQRIYAYASQHKDIPREKITFRPDPIQPHHFERLITEAGFDLNDPLLLMQFESISLTMVPVDDLNTAKYGLLCYLKKGAEAAHLAERGTLTDSQLQELDGWPNPFYAEMCRRIIAHNQEVTAAGKNRITPTPDVPKEKLFEAIIAPHKGKVILVDFWNTWCGPCRAALRANEPLKSGELADENLVWIYIANETSPMATYLESIPQIKGIHYRLNPEQWAYLTGEKMFNIDGIPSYVVVQKDGRAALRNDLRDHSQLVSTLKEALK